MAVIQGGGITYDSTGKFSQAAGQFAGLAQNLAQLRQQASQFDKEFSLNQERLRESQRQFDESVRQFGITEQRLAEGLKLQKQVQALNTVQQEMSLAKEFAGRLGTRNFLGSAEGEGALRRIAENMAIAQGVDPTPETVEKYVTDVTVSINAWTDPQTQALLKLSEQFDVVLPATSETPGAAGAATYKPVGNAAEVPETKILSRQGETEALREQQMASAAGSAAQGGSTAAGSRAGYGSTAEMFAGVGSENAPADLEKLIADAVGRARARLAQAGLTPQELVAVANDSANAPEVRNAAFELSRLETGAGAAAANAPAGGPPTVPTSQAKEQPSVVNAKTGMAVPTVPERNVAMAEFYRLKTGNALQGENAGLVASTYIQQNNLGPEFEKWLVQQGRPTPETDLGMPGAARFPLTTPTTKAQPQAAPGVSQTGAPSKYTVVSGDTLRAIAEKNKVSLKSLIDANKLVNEGFNPDAIRPGQEIVIPGQPTTGIPSDVKIRQVSNAVGKATDFTKIVDIMGSRGVTPDQIVDTELDAKKASTVQTAAKPIFDEAVRAIQTAADRPDNRVAQYAAKRAAARAGSWFEKVFKTATPSQKAKMASDLMVELENMTPEAIAIKYGTDIAGVRMAKDEQTIAVQNALLAAASRSTKDDSMENLRKLMNDLSNNWNRTRDNVYSVYQNEVPSKERDKKTFDWWIADPRNKTYADMYTQAYNRFAEVEAALFSGDAVKMVVEQTVKGGLFGIGGTKGGVRYTAGNTQTNAQQQQGSKAATDYVNNALK